MSTFNQKERDAIGIFLHDAYHTRETKRKMQLLADMYEMNELFYIIDKLVTNGSMIEDDGMTLKKKMAKFYL